MICAAVSPAALAQTMNMPPPRNPESNSRSSGSGTSDDMANMSGMNMSGPMMAGALGTYSMMRDASGTSWQPDSTPMLGVSTNLGDWTAMLYGDAYGVYDDQTGPRGNTKPFSESMFMAMLQHPLGPGTFTWHSMFSLDPFMGKSGYPLLLQTGETADGIHPLIDRQHPHNFLMELAGSYSVPLASNVSTFLYAGYPGEPALGPVTFMHRFSGMDDPAAPITHHWLDSTHVSFGVVTAGVVDGDWKLEGSLFNGHEPDQFRWGFDDLGLNSGSARLSWNPDANWALQVSYGFLKSPEQLEPGVDQHRTTASATYNLPIPDGNWQTTFAWGRNADNPGAALDALLLESAVTWDAHTVFARAENVQKDDLFQLPSPFAGDVFRASELSFGYIYDIPVLEHVALGIGGVGTVDLIPAAIKPAYGSDPVSFMAFLRLKAI